jgi:hypothetical protein
VYPDTQFQWRAQKLRAQGLIMTETGKRMGYTKRTAFYLLHPGRR